MAYVKCRPVQHADNQIRYIFAKQLPGDPSFGEKCTPEAEATIAEFKAVRDLYPNKRRKWQAYEVFQSWSPEESKKLTREQVNQMGRELAEQYFKGHQFVVVTHSNRPHLHNHIFVNAVNIETGKSIPPKIKHVYRLREISDQICRANGLSIINQEAIERAARTPDKVQRMQRFKGHSYILDMMEKADFARKYATSYDQYKAILLEFGIGVQIEKKNITYFYPGHEKGKRGDKMGKVYNKPSLEKTFRENDEKFQKNPEGLASLKAEMAGMKGKKGESLKLPITPPAQDKGYGAFTKTSRGSGKYQYPSDEALKDSVIPIGEIQRARQVSIIDYCKRNRIALTTNAKGETVLKGKEFAVVSDQEWVNTKNKTRGTIIEFVAARHNTTYLGAIAKINNNPRLLLLEQHFGEEKRVYTSFYIPKSQRADPPNAATKLGRLLQSFGAKPEMAKTLLDKERAQVSKSGAIRIFAVGDDSGAWEYVPNQNGTWAKKKLGNARSPFVSKPGFGNKVMIFTDPSHALKERGSRLFADQKDHEGILVLWEPDHKHVDQFVASHRNVTELIFVPGNQKSPSKAELDFFNNLKKRYANLDIEVRVFELGRELTRGGPDLSL
jgi:hypothetical protein